MTVMEHLMVLIIRGHEILKLAHALKFCGHNLVFPIKTWPQIITTCASSKTGISLVSVIECLPFPSLQPDPPPCAGLRGRGVCVSRSASDPALMEGALGLSEAALDAAAPQSSRLSWKSETEDRGTSHGLQHTVMLVCKL